MGYGQLKPDGYIPRIADRQLERMLAILGAVEVAAHIAVLQDLNVVEQVTGWDAPMRSKTRLRHATPSWSFSRSSWGRGSTPA